MLVIPGIIASANYPRVTSSYESIATVTVGAGGSSSISFTSIPSTYKHLQIRFLGKDNRSGNNVDAFLMTFNSDSTSKYWQHWLYGNGSSAIAGNDGSLQTSFQIYRIGGGTSGSSFGAGIIDILDYTSTNKNKTIRSLGGIDNNGSGEIWFLSGLYSATPASVSTITATPANGTLFSEYSSFALYGVKG